MNKLKLVFWLAGITLLASCDKADPLPFFGTGSAPVLTASAAAIAPQPADSNKVALTLNWTNPKYAADSASFKYTVEIDSTGKNFSRPFVKATTGQMGTSFTAKELNQMLLARGYAFNVPVDMDVRVISSYANNNERLVSNVLKVRMTPYKIPPRVALPASGKLFIVGGATQGGWTNPVPVPAQEFVRIDETTFGGIFQLTGGSYYLLLPENGSWSSKFAVPDNSIPGLNQGGDFQFYTSGGSDFPGPATSGLYKIIVDFQTGKFTVTPFTQQHGLPTELFIVGDATPGGWNNPVPVPAQQFTRINSSQFELTLALNANKNYLFLPENGNWGKKFGAVNNTANIKLGGPFAPEGQDIPSPESAGNYKITVDFLSGQYKLVKI